MFIPLVILGSLAGAILGVFAGLLFVRIVKTITSFLFYQMMHGKLEFYIIVAFMIGCAIFSGKLISRWMH
jgi:ABC-type antimicrobial peptide transport system permease subunit